MLEKVFASLEHHDVDILHGDFNQAMAQGTLQQVMSGFSYVTPHQDDLAVGQTKRTGDCCGFCLRNSRFMHHATISAHGTWEFDYHDILGLAASDQGAHWMNFVHFRSIHVSRDQDRSAQAKARRRQRYDDKRRFSHQPHQRYQRPRHGQPQQ
mgnify:CR=1 FL=1